METIGNFHGELVSQGERRWDVRTATLYRPILIETEEFAGFCLLRNLSPNGMRGRVYTTFAEGLSVTLQFSPDIVVEGSLIWCKDEHIGVEFSEAINVRSILADLARPLVEGKINRAPRLQIHCDGQLVIGDRSLAIELEDISQRGLRISASFIKPGDEVHVQLRGLDRKAIVRWTQGRSAGLNFIRPLAFEELANWVIRQQSCAGDKMQAA